MTRPYVRADRRGHPVRYTILDDADPVEADRIAGLKADAVEALLADGHTPVDGPWHTLSPRAVNTRCAVPYCFAGVTVILDAPAGRWHHDSRRVCIAVDAAPPEPDLDLPREGLPSLGELVDARRRRDTVVDVLLDPAAVPATLDAMRTLVDEAHR